VKRPHNGYFLFARRLVATLTLATTAVAAMVATSPSVGSITSTKSSPVSVSFLASGEGWALAKQPCQAGLCVNLERTSNEGRSWTSLPLPVVLQHLTSENISDYFPFVSLNLYFANAKDGWLYGSVQPGLSSTGTYVTPVAELWSTHDGGATWSSLPARSLGMKFNVLAVSAHQGEVYAMAWRASQTFGLWRSPAGSNSWQRVATPTLYAAAGGTAMQGALIFKGANGWLMVGNDRATTGSARLTSSGRWVKWTAPCTSVGSAFAVPVATSATTLIDVCTIGGYGADVAPTTPHYLKLGSNWVFASQNAGLTFKPTSRVVVDHSSQWLSPVPGLPASPAPGVILVAKVVPQDQKSSDHLYLSSNEGRTWTSVLATPTSAMSGTIQSVTFASPRLGAAIVQTSPTSSKLIVSSNEGRTWRDSLK